MLNTCHYCTYVQQQQCYQDEAYALCRAPVTCLDNERSVCYKLEGIIFVTSTLTIFNNI